MKFVLVAQAVQPFVQVVIGNNRQGSFFEVFSIGVYLLVTVFAELAAGGAGAVDHEQSQLGAIAKLALDLALLVDVLQDLRSGVLGIVKTMAALRMLEVEDGLLKIICVQHLLQK